MRSSNPVLTRLGEAARHERASSSYDLGDYQVAKPYAPPQLTQSMTLDDVVVRTVSLLLVTGITGAFAWMLLPAGVATGLALIGSSLAALVLVLVITFGRITNPVPIVAYAVIEGVLLGVASKWFEARFPGIVLQAVIGTFGIFAIMAVLYLNRVLRATPRFTRIVVGALIGLVVLGFVNLIATMLGHNLGLVQYDLNSKAGMLAVLFTLAAIVVGALTFIVDFDAIEQGVRYGLPQRYSWYCAFGLLVGLIFLYWQVLRMLGYLRR